jgi:hypothetical protein
LTNDRAQVTGVQAALNHSAQSLDAEQTKFKLGASTARILQQARNLAVADRHQPSSLPVENPLSNDPSDIKAESFLHPDGILARHKHRSALCLRLDARLDRNIA